MTERRSDSSSLQRPDKPEVGDALTAVATLDEPNRRRLYALVAELGEVSRDHAARELGISRELAAFHLDRLVEVGLLRAGYRRLTGRTGPGAGRPAKVYRRTDHDVSVTLPPRRYESLAALFAEGLERIASATGQAPIEGAIASAADERGRDAGADVLAAAGPRPSRRRLRNALLRLLEERGYEPELAANNSVILRNCPYRTMSETHRDLTCGANRAWAEGLVDHLGDPGLVAAFDPLPGRCCVSFTESPEPVDA